VVLVVPPGHEEAAQSLVNGLVDGPANGVVSTVPGGDTRSASVRAGLAALERTGSDDDIVVVHDAARPAAEPELFASVVAGVAAGADGCVPGVPVTDSLKRVDEGRVVASVDRDHLVAVQTPQAFRLGVLRRAHATGGDATDDAALVEAGGGTIVVVSGSLTNTKVTVVDDLDRVATELAGRAPA
jgi:2-C-methyl-D-erythritol 4-phosphate cytidylyltransferase